MGTDLETKIEELAIKVKSPQILKLGKKEYIQFNTQFPNCNAFITSFGIVDIVKVDQDSFMGVE